MSICKPADWAFHYYENQHDLVRLLARMVGDREIAKDLAQDTYLRVSQGDNDVWNIGNPRAYLFTIATNLARDFLRKRVVRREDPVSDAGLENMAADAASQEQQYYDRQRLVMLQDAIENLPEKTRQAFILRKIEGLGSREIATHMGISQNMVEKHLRKALALAREHVKKNDQ